MAAIDLYSGVGGWTLGLRMAGIPVLASYEWWKDANRTHNMNFGSFHKETDIRALSMTDLPNSADVDFVVGSPPCTQFSYANRGGNGDIKDGLVDIMKFLEVVEHMQPRYWAMENVPRVAKILEKELSSRGKLVRFKDLFSDIRIFNSADYGVPQDRKRMIAGKLPFELLDSYAKVRPKLNLRIVLDALDDAPFKDPIYDLTLDLDSLTDHILEPNLSFEEARINQESKVHHPVYNRMSFPDNQDRPSRTITALCTRVSRESIIIRDVRSNLRRLTIRERACIQSFPINYQFFGSSYANKIKMIGNAVPPLLTFYIAQSMLETPVDRLLDPNNLQDKLELSQEKAMKYTPDNEGSKYPWNRSFWLAIKGLRFGSGVRFELKNHNEKKSKVTTWRINFFYGSSKAIRQKILDQEILTRAIQMTKLEANTAFVALLNDLRSFIRTVDERSVQQNWTNLDRTRMSPIYLVDELAHYVTKFKALLKEQGDRYVASIDRFIMGEFPKDHKNLPETKVPRKPNKLTANGVDIFIGILIGAYFNTMMMGGVIKLKKIRDIKRTKVRA